MARTLLEHGKGAVGRVELLVHVAAVVRQPETLLHRQAREESPPLRYVDHAQVHDRLRRPACDFVAVETDGAFEGPDDAGERTQGGRLARAVAADAGDDLAPADLQVEVANDLDTAVAGMERLDLEQVSLFGGCNGSPGWGRFRDRDRSCLCLAG